MHRLNSDQSQLFADAVRQAEKRNELVGPLSAIYQSVADAVELNQPRCTASGACCRFDEYGHALFVTTIEVAVFLAGLSDEQPTGDAACPYQIGGRCSVHTIRPFGCRIFYCDPTAEQWQQALYDRLHRQIRMLHDRLDVPYFYVEWREALRTIKANSLANTVISGSLL